MKVAKQMEKVDVQNLTDGVKREVQVVGMAKEVERNK